MNDYDILDQDTEGGRIFDEYLDADETVIGYFKPNKKRYLRAFWMFALPIFWPHMAIIFALTLGIVPILFVKKGYDNRWYAYTNKRVIVRGGSFGVSYSSIDYKDIVNVDASTSFLDRRTHTGSIEFRTQHRTVGFLYIENPYDVLREIRQYMANNT